MAYGWQGVFEGETLIALERNKASVSLEPAGQFELSGAPLETIHEISAETAQHLEESKHVADALGLGFLGLGFTPTWTRADVWTDTDADRTGLLRFVFEDGFGFETYAKYALDVPMYFVKRGETYIDVAGRSFRQFMAGDLPELPGEKPKMKDWSDHLTTLFPEVRLKQYLEMRGADTGPVSRLNALPALWAGILYDKAALAAAWDLCKGWSAESREQLRLDAARTGLKGQVEGRPIRDVAVDMVAIAKEGLKRRARLCPSGADETGYLSELEEIADSGLTPADRLLELYHGPWQGDVSRAYDDLAY